MLTAAVKSGYGNALAHETTHFMFESYTRMWQRRDSWTWTTSDDYRDHGLSEALAWYNGDSYYKFGPTWSSSKIKSELGGYMQLIEKSAYYYMFGYGSSDDIANFIAFGYFLHNKFGLSAINKLCSQLRYYNMQDDAQSFKKAYEAAFGYEWFDDQYIVSGKRMTARYQWAPSRQGGYSVGLLRILELS